MKKLINDPAKQKVDMNKLTNKVDENKDIYELPNGPYMVPMRNNNGEIMNIAVNITDYIQKAYDYVRNNTMAFIGQCIVVLYDPVFIDKYNPSVYCIKNISLRPILEYVGKVLYYKGDGKLIPTNTVLTGQLCTYNNSDYFYDGNNWVPLDNQIIDTSKINSPKDIIDVFDKLQERATELGYPIKLFTKERPIHPIRHGIDTKLTLTYEENRPNVILAAINVKETIENLMKLYGDKNNG